jgi:hypothetical protein
MREWPSDDETGEGDVYRMDEQELREHQGWTDRTVLRLVRAFLGERGLEDDFLRFMQQQAEEENHVPGA